MKSVFLIIDSDFPHYENYNRCREVWKRYMNTDTNIQCFFIRFEPNLLEDILIHNDTLYFKGNESFYPGILDKTIRAMKYCCENYNFDFLVRTNLSSFWVFENYNKYISTLGKEKVANGIIGNCEYGSFMSGCGFILSKDVVEFMCNNMVIKDLPNVYDDVAIGVFLNKNNITLSFGTRGDLWNIPREKVIETIMEQKSNYYHYRVKYDMGPHDAYVMEQLVKFHYNL